MIHALVEQGTQEWLQLRCGSITGSRIADMLKTIKSGAYAASRIDYAYDLALERLTGEPQNTDLSNVKWVQDGKAWEDDARAMYEFTNDLEVERIGFASHDIIEMFGASPDGLIGDSGVLEIKCPKPKTHLAYLIEKVMPAEYVPQVNAELSCTGREWVDFVSYNPKFPPNLRFFCVRHYRNNRIIADMEESVNDFNDEVEEILEKLKLSA